MSRSSCSSLSEGGLQSSTQLDTLMPVVRWRSGGQLVTQFFRLLYIGRDLFYLIRAGVEIPRHSDHCHLLSPPVTSCHLLLSPFATSGTSGRTKLLVLLQTLCIISVQHTSHQWESDSRFLSSTSLKSELLFLRLGFTTPEHDVSGLL